MLTETSDYATLIRDFRWDIPARFNIATGALATDIPELRAPAGSYVIAVQE